MNFVLLERLLEVDLTAPELGGKAVAEASLPEGHPVFKDHFPGYELVPGTLQTEMMAQCGGWWLAAESGFKSKSVLIRIEDALFREPVFPGEKVHVIAYPENVHDSRAAVKAEIRSIPEESGKPRKPEESQRESGRLKSRASLYYQRQEIQSFEAADSLRDWVHSTWKKLQGNDGLKDPSLAISEGAKESKSQKVQIGFCGVVPQTFQLSLSESVEDSTEPKLEEVKSLLKSPKAMKLMDRRARLLRVAAERSDISLLQSVVSDRRGLILDVGPHSVQRDPFEELFSSVNFASPEGESILQHEGGKVVSAIGDEMPPLWLLQHLPNMPAGNLAIELEISGPSQTMGMDQSLQLPYAEMLVSEAVAWLHEGKADVVLCGWSRVTPPSVVEEQGKKAGESDFALAVCLDRELVNSLGLNQGNRVLQRLGIL